MIIFLTLHPVKKSRAKVKTEILRANEVRHMGSTSKQGSVIKIIKDAKEEREEPISQKDPRQTLERGGGKKEGEKTSEYSK